MLFYTLRALSAHPGRALSIVTGFALAFSAVLFAYAIAAGIQRSSASALAYIVSDQSVWITAPGGPRIDPATRALVQDETLSREVESGIRAASSGPVRSIEAKRGVFRGERVTVYWDSAAGAGVSMSSQLADRLRARHGEDTAPARSALRVREDLPGLSIVRPFETGRQATWILASPTDTNVWARQTATKLHLTLRDSAAGKFERAGQGSIFLLKGSLSRFDPFSFQTKFSAFQVNSATATLLGWLARAVFLFGAVLVVSSARIGIAERRAEIAALTVLGYQPELTLLVLLENTLLLLVAMPIAFLLAGIMAAQVFPIDAIVANLASAGGLTLFFIPVVLVAATLWAGQYVAGQSEVELVRGGA